MFEATRFLVFIFSVVIHEVAHGLVARHFGDHTAENAGRLTLNPIPHIDPIGSILMPLVTSQAGFTFGWAKPVPVNPLHFKDIRSGELWVSFAGPLSNLALAFTAGLIFKLMPQDPTSIISLLLLNTIIINTLLAVLNLLPIPPLDGSKMLMSYLPYNLLRNYEKLTPYGFFIIIGLSYFGFLRPVFEFAISIVRTLLAI